MSRLSLFVVRKIKNNLSLKAVEVEKGVRMSEKLSYYFTQPSVVKRAAVVAIIVGTILNLINQGDNFIAQTVTWWKVILTYMVPYCVSTYSSAAERSRKA